jgi:hypothetical protein
MNHVQSERHAGRLTETTSNLAHGPNPGLIIHINCD